MEETYYGAAETQYAAMCIKENQAKLRYGIAAAGCAWITLAGFITLPNTFTSLQTSSILSEKKSSRIIQNTVSNLQLLPLANGFCLIGLLGIYFLWGKFRENYV